jgi:hypothetical protein
MQNRTLFIIGAGASREAGLPIGTELIDIVVRQLNYQSRDGVLDRNSGDPDIIDVLQQHANTRPEMAAYLAAAARIRDGVIYSNSIDSFIDIHKDDPRIQMCGKLAIVKTILDAERKSGLWISNGSNDFIDLGNLKSTWFFTFMRNVSDGVRKGEIERIFAQVSFIIFNYDRCFEHFLFHALQAHYGIDEQKSASLMRTLKIIHPYGAIGDLPWQDGNGIPYGFIANRANLQDMASRIKTYTEQVEERDELATIHHEVKIADTLVFLGFSYHPQNMRLLKPDTECSASKVFGTAVGIAASDMPIILDQVRKIIGRSLKKFPHDRSSMMMSEPIHIHNDLKCAALLQEYSRSLFQAGLR